MVAFGPARISPIGVSFNERFIKAAQLVRTNDNWRLSSAVSIPRTSGTGLIGLDEAKWLRSVLSRQRFKGSKMVLAVPQDKFLTGVLELPPRREGVPLGQIVDAELARLHGFSPGTVETGFWDLPASKGKDGIEVLAVACKHEISEEIVDIFESAGLDVAALDSPVNSLVRACESLLADDSITVILDLDWHWASLALIGQGQIVYQRVIEGAGLGQLSDVLADRLELDDQAVDYILSEIGLAGNNENSCDMETYLDLIGPTIKSHLDLILEDLEAPISYVQRLCPGQQGKVILLSGQGAGIPGVGEYIQSQSEMSVRLAVPAYVIECPPSLSDRSDDPSLTSAVGLCQFPM